MDARSNDKPLRTLAPWADQQYFRVVFDGDRQHALWPVAGAPPPGWQEIGFFADRAACLRYIEELGRPAVPGAQLLPGADLPDGVLVELDEPARQARTRALELLAGSTSWTVDPLEPDTVSQLPQSVLAGTVQPAGGGRALIVLGFAETGLTLTAGPAPCPGSGSRRALPELPLQAADGSRIYVLDEDLHPVPAGRPGALYVGGPALAVGYAGQAGLTALRFLPDPLAGPGERMFATQLPARRTSGGTLRLEPE